MDLVQYQQQAQCSAMNLSDGKLVSELQLDALLSVMPLLIAAAYDNIEKLRKRHRKSTPTTTQSLDLTRMA